MAREDWEVVGGVQVSPRHIREVPPLKEHGDIAQGDPEDLLQVHDVARFAGVTPSAVRLWADAGRIPTIKTMSGQRLFRRKDVLAYFISRRDLQ